MMKSDGNHDHDGLFVFIHYVFFLSFLSLTVKRNTHVYYPSHVIPLHCIFCSSLNILELFVFCQANFSFVSMLSVSTFYDTRVTGM